MHDPTANPLDLALATLDQGGLVLLPVDTVPGLAVRADRPEALRSLYLAKDRPANKTLALAFRDLEHVLEWLPLTPVQQDQARILLPGPFTLVVEGSEQLGAWWPAWALSVGLRVPGPCPCTPLLESLPWPLALSSANRSGDATPLQPGQVAGEMLARTGYQWPGDCPWGQESTVVDLRPECPRLLRQGAGRLPDDWGRE